MTKTFSVILRRIGPVVILLVGFVSCQKAVDFTNPLDPRVALATPDSIRVVAMSESMVTLAWSANLIKSKAPQAKELWIILERSEDGSTFVPLDSVRGPFLTWSFVGAFGIGQKYFFRIHATIGDNTSLPSGVVSAVLRLDPPTNLSVTFQSNARRQFTWQDNSNVEGGFVVERRILGDAAPQAYVQIGFTPTNITAFADTTTVFAHIGYRYRVCAIAPSGIKSANDSLDILDAFSAPTDLTCGGDQEHSVTLHWTNQTLYPTTPIVEKATPNSSYAVVATLPAGTDSYNDNSVGRDNSYYYRVRVTTARDTSNYSPEIHTAFRNYSFEPIATLETGHWHNFVAISRDGGTILLWAQDSSVLQLWGAFDHSLHRSIALPYQASAVAISGNGQVVGVAVKDSGTFCFYAANDGHLMSTVRVPSPAFDLQISDDGAVAITTGAEPTISMWSTATGSTFGSLHGHSSYPVALWLNDDGHTLVSGADQTMKTWDWMRQAQTSSVPGGLFTKPIFQRYSGDFYSMRYQYPNIVIFDMTLGKVVSARDVMGDDLRLGWISPDGYTIVFGYVGLLIYMDLATPSSGLSIYCWARQVVGIPGSNTDFIVVNDDNTTLTIYRMLLAWR